MGALIRCKGLSKDYAGQTIFGGLSFELQAGEALLVRGLNGTGKTTLLSLLAGLVQAEAGEIAFLGEAFDSRSHKLRSRIGFSPATDVSLFLNATVRENLIFWAYLQGLGPEARKDKLGEFAEIWGFSTYLDRPARELSSGYRRRVALARAFLHDPSLVLLDEPFAFLDNENTTRTIERLESWLSESKGALVVSSNVEFTRKGKWKNLDLQSI